MRTPEDLDRQLRNLHEAFGGLTAELRCAVDCNGKWFVSFYGVEAVEGRMLASLCGRGDTIQQACWDYIHKLVGKRLRFGSGEHRREIVVVQP